MKVAIIGPGLVGHSVALAARRADADTDIVEIDRGQSLEPVRGADLIVLATPVDVILDVIRRHADILRTAVAIDTGSTKRLIVRTATEAGLTRFVGGHPMAGAAASGPQHARADLFDGHFWFLVTQDADADAIAIAQRFVTGLGARALLLQDDGTEHDRVMAAVSHLPQMVAAALVVVAADAAGERLGWAGSGLRDTTRLAGSSGAMWQSIADTNAAELRPLLSEMAQRLQQLADQLGDGTSVQALLHAANQKRALL